MNHERRVLLASSSPRRIELFSCLGLTFDWVRPQVNELEAAKAAATTREIAERSALAKAKWAMEDCSADIVVSADTIVVLRGEVLGKPADGAEAVSMLKRLRGRRHQVVTGLAVLDSNGGIVNTHVTASVTMRRYSDSEIEAYVATGDPLDKAGAYGIQNVEFHPAAKVSGCYLSVVGLPLCELARLLACAGYGLPGVRSWPDACTRCPHPLLPLQA